MRSTRWRRPFLASLIVAGAVAAAVGSAGAQEPEGVDPLLAQAIGYYTGTIGQVDDPRAHDLLVEAAADGDALSQMWLARCYSRGRMLFDRDEARARDLASTVIEQVRVLAEQHSAAAAFLMGTAHAEALGVDADNALAIAWYHRAADLGNVLAQQNLGNAYRNGDGVAEDAGMAVYWYRKAALQGDALPAFWLGQMYEQGEGVRANDEWALRWYRASAARGNARAGEAVTRLQSR